VWRKDVAQRAQPTLLCSLPFVILPPLLTWWLWLPDFIFVPHLLLPEPQRLVAPLLLLLLAAKWAQR